MSSFPSINCPITLMPMQDPVKAPDGHTYERMAIIRAIETSGMSPLTRQSMSVDQLVTDYTLKKLIEEISGAKTEEPVYKDPPVEATLKTEGNVSQLTLGVNDGVAGPNNVAFVVDISGSMNTEVKTSSGESDGFNILDVVKHAINTCMLGMRPIDKACIIGYSTRARVVMPLRQMDAGGKGIAKIKLVMLEPENSTNIWEGIQLAIEQLSGGGTIFLLTDGQPNVRPNRGEVYELKKIMDGRDNITLNTYGFGYNLDSALLFDLSRVTSGSYGFIPDIGLVGTVFVHAMANLRTMTQCNLMLSIETEGTIDMPEFKKIGWGYQYTIGRLCMGQQRDIFIECDKPFELNIEGVEIQPVDGPLDNADRQQAALSIMRCHHLAKVSLEETNAYLNGIIGKMTEAGVIEDMNGQVREAIQAEAYRKWGRHYLPSLFLSHWTQQCNNFLDKGIQKYGGLTFQKTRDDLDGVFDNMPAPKPTHRNRVVERCRSTGRSVPMQTSTMESYNSAGAPCFAGPCQVHMQDGSKKMVRDIVKGDVVQTSSGFAKVRCVLKTICKNSVCEFVRLNKLIVTPWHPIKRNRWLFPIQLFKSETLPCEAVYSFLLEENVVSMIIEEEECITLAHGIQDDVVAEHPFYGTQKIITEMKSLEGYQEGLVKIVGVKRDVNTHLVCGFIQ
jgi:hypothetical protein